MQVLHQKLSKTSPNQIKSAELYDGSIIDFDSRLCGFDIGTCLEVLNRLLAFETIEVQYISLVQTAVLSSLEYFRKDQILTLKLKLPILLLFPSTVNFLM